MCINNERRGFMEYKIGDRFTSKNYTEFQIINVFPHYDGTIVTIKYKRDHGELSSFYEKKFKNFVDERKYILEMGQVNMGVEV